ncbi:MAG TPA: carnitine dehydratase, partial [Chloroflexi bacterium]|nr:carnitine dehydratase [Chloroflexota bacterium]
MESDREPKPDLYPCPPLADVRVVALEQAVSAPLCTRHLADMGADVVKLERPDGGDFARRYDTVVHGQSAYFVWLNRGKRSVTLDVKAPADQPLLEALLARADVFVHNLGPGVIDRLGLGWEVLHERWPRLISCGISGYGSEGPYTHRKAFDLLVQGESGLPSITGTPEEPVKVGISIADIGAGLYAFSAILVALYERVHTGEGRMIDISMLECLAEWMMVPAYYQLYSGAPPARMGMRHNMIVPYGPYRVGDGSIINLAVQNEGQWRRLCELVLCRPELADDPRFRRNHLRLEHREVLEAMIEESLVGETGESVRARLDVADVPHGTLNDLEGLLAHPQLAARQRWFDIESPAGAVRALAHP